MSRHSISASWPTGRALAVPAEPEGSRSHRGLAARLVAAAGVVVLLSGCAAEQEDVSGQGRDPYTAVSPTEEGQEHTSAEESLKASAALSEEEMAEILLAEGELPFTADEVEEFRGTEYFHEHIGVAGETYVQNFGDEECARQMDTINERLVGDDPVDGVLREASRHIGAGDETIFVWMLGYEEAPDREALWDEVLEACEGTVLQSEDDQVSFSSFTLEGFRGMALDMTVDNGVDILEVEGFAATLEYEETLLMLSAVNVEAEDFESAVLAQAEKLQAFDAAR